ncbi:MAG: ERCC4 domain-containing protein [Planctomycetota bacterium]
MRRVVGGGWDNLRVRTKPEPRNESSRHLEIVFDAGELRSGLPELVKRRWRPVDVRRLSVGDVAIGRLLVERKEAHDFVQSLRSGRLFRQAYRLRAASARPLLLVEGDPRELVGEAELGGLRGAYFSLLTGYSIPILRTRDLQATSECLLHFAAQEARRRQRRERDQEVRRRVKTQPPVFYPSPDQRTLAVLDAVPGVGPFRARALLHRFGSLEGILAADPAELAKTPGVGGATAARLLSALLGTARSLSRAGAEGTAQHDGARDASGTKSA